MKKIGIIGTRRRNLKRDFLEVKEAFFSVYEEGDIIVSGGCQSGGDAFAERLARSYGIPILILHARWNHDWDGNKFVRRKRTNLKAGFIRNTPIAEESDILIACVSPDRTGGTEDTINKFEKLLKGGALILV